MRDLQLTSMAKQSHCGSLRPARWAAVLSEVTNPAMLTVVTGVWDVEELHVYSTFPIGKF